MTFNQCKSLIHNIKPSFLSNNQMERQRKENEQECLQFGICTLEAQSHRQEELYFGQE